MLSHTAQMLIDLTGFGQNVHCRDMRACVRSTKTTAKKTTVTTV